jgi:predicted permease
MNDLKFAFRQLLKNPGFTAVAVLTLALGIGANTAIFSVVNAVMLRTLPVPDPERLALVAIQDRQSSEEIFSFPVYEQLRAQNHSFASLGAASGERPMQMSMGALSPAASIEPVRAQIVSGNFFSTLGVPALMGRTLAAADDRSADPQPVVVISHGFWQRRFAGDPAVVGRSFALNDVPVTIVGVAPRGFFGIQVGANPDVWLPLQMLPQMSGPAQAGLNDRGFTWLHLMGYLQPGISREQAAAEMDVIFWRDVVEQGARPGEQSADGKRSEVARKVVVRPGAAGWTQLRNVFREPLFVLMGSVALVLLIACGNVANLLLARSVTRRKEMALRLAIGASRGQLVRQLLTESLVLASWGGALGLFFAYVGTPLLLSCLPSSSIPIPILLDVAPDLRVLGFTLAVCAFTGTLFGLAPALRATRFELTATLKEPAGNASAGVSRLALNNALVVGQLALSLLLLAGAGLFVRSLQKLRSIDTGFAREHLVQFRLDPGDGYDTARRQLLYREMLERLEGLPGARAASLTFIMPLSDSGWGDKLVVEGNPLPTGEGSTFRGMKVGPRFLETMGIPLISGRDFSARDNRPVDPQTEPAAPWVMMVNQSLARQLFGSEDAIGRRLALASRPQEMIEIVGIVKDVKYRNLRDSAPATFYLPFFQYPTDFATFVVRTTGDPPGLVGMISKLVREINPRLQVQALQTMAQRVDELLIRERILAQMAGVFGVFALLLAALGLYGVLAYVAASRRREIGIRMAIGARPTDVLGLVIKRGMELVCLGTFVGSAGAIVATRFLKTLLYGVEPTDPATFACVILLLASVGLLACWLPARRAARVDPMEALRYE